MMEHLAIIPSSAVRTGTDDDWTPMRRLTRDRLRELPTIDRRFALIHFHATRCGGNGYASILDPDEHPAASHLHELHALGLTATGQDKAELVTNYMRLLSGALERGTAQ